MSFDTNSVDESLCAAVELPAETYLLTLVTDATPVFGFKPGMSSLEQIWALMDLRKQAVDKMHAIAETMKDSLARG